MQEIVLGTIGSGNIVRSILDAAVVTDGIRCGAVYSRDLAKGLELASDYGAEHVYGNLEELLNDPSANFIYIASPNSLHAEHIRLSLEHGKNVICEKPLTPIRAVAETLFSLADAKKLLLIEAVPTPFLPNFPILLRQLPRVGRVRLVQGNYSQYSSRYDQLLAGQTPNVFNPDYAGGCLLDINLYNVYLNVALFGTPNAANYYPNRHPNGIDTSGVLILQYNDFISSCAAAKDTWGDNIFLIEGEKGYIRVRDGSNGLAEIRVVTRTSDETFNEQPVPDRWFYEVQGWVRLISQGTAADLQNLRRITLDTLGILEQARRQAGIRLAGDPDYGIRL